MIRRLWNNSAMRFVVVGGINTVATYAIFVLLGLVMPAWLAFTIAFAAGLAWVVFGSARVVFRARSSPSRLLLFALWYLLVYAMGRLIVQLIDPVGVVALLLTSAVIIVVTTPLSYLGGRMIFRTAPQLDAVPSARQDPER
jgi:putative flippase GtrA